MAWHNPFRNVYLLIRLGLVVALSAALVLSFGRVPVAHAAYLTVTNANDSGPGSLRQTITDASPGDTIVFVRDLRDQTITLTSEPLDISKDLTILGPGASRVKISGNRIMRVLHIGQFATVRLENLAIVDGRAITGTVRIGGGIANDGTLTVSNSAISGNNANAGGGIYNSGTLIVSGSTINTNGVGVYNENPLAFVPIGAAIANYGQLTVADSTFDDNYIVAPPNLVNIGGVIYNDNTLRLINSTIVSPDGFAGIRNTAGSVAVVKNTLFDAPCGGVVSSDSTHNLTTYAGCDQSFTLVTPFRDLQLGSLQNNGGATQTIALLPGSRAIDAGDNAVCAAAPVNNRDQRGMVRPQGHTCDIGAFEAEHQNTPPTANDDSYSTIANAPLTVAAPGVLANDIDPDTDPLQVRLSIGPEHGTLTLNTDGSFTYTPNDGFVGTDMFTYTAFDGGDIVGGATVMIIVAQLAASDDSYTVQPNAGLKVFAPGVLENDTYEDGKPITARLVGEPTYGTLTLFEDGSFVYIPKDGFIGVDQFTYQVTDGYQNSKVATVMLTRQKYQIWLSIVVGN